MSVTMLLLAIEKHVVIQVLLQKIPVWLVESDNLRAAEVFFR